MLIVLPSLEQALLMKHYTTEYVEYCRISIQKMGCRFFVKLIQMEISFYSFTSFWVTFNLQVSVMNPVSSELMYCNSFGRVPSLTIAILWLSL